ncbi:MAG: glutathione S-transferase C-terminal domain-containing protein, partial [Alphaproteobacteria bacterium]|nr:glutathione S-transferase C-terminal domain-containing protein [Alphaproteobacteria bacterium]MBU1463967.1 glutathione S-transferase C-terminal domain-containing protein [Alphaproteobacteria bacterium]
DRYKYADRFGADPVEHRLAGLSLLGDLEERLADASNLTRDTRSITDIAIFPFVRQFASVDRSWFDAQGISRVQRWLATHIASPLFERAMVRLKPWSPEDDAVMWPS